MLMLMLMLMLMCWDSRRMAGQVCTGWFSAKRISRSASQQSRTWARMRSSHQSVDRPQVED